MKFDLKYLHSYVQNLPIIFERVEHFNGFRSFLISGVTPEDINLVFEDEREPCGPGCFHGGYFPPLFCLIIDKGTLFNAVLFAGVE